MKKYEDITTKAMWEIRKLMLVPFLLNVYLIYV